MLSTTDGTETVERWSLADERRCTAKCKRCGCPIIWGEVVETIGHVEDKRRWLPLDPDSSPHACNVVRVFTRRVPIDTTRPSIEDLLAAARLPVGSELGEEGTAA